MTVLTPDTLKAERLAQITEARKYLKWVLMDVVEQFAENNKAVPQSRLLPQASGYLTNVWKDIETLDKLRQCYEQGNGPFADYLL